MQAASLTQRVVMEKADMFHYEWGGTGWDASLGAFLQPKSMQVCSRTSLRLSMLIACRSPRGLKTPPVA